MKLNTDMHHRRSIRLRGYDYSQCGAYFVTVCAHHRECLLGEILNNEMKLSKAGKIVADEWMKTAIIRHEIGLDTFVVMPNHFHAIVWITDGRGDRPVAPTTHTSNSQIGPQAKSIGSLLAGFKSAVTKRINEYHSTPRKPFWQRNYYEHVIRDDEELNQTRQYIMDNPKKWMEDEENPINMKSIR